MTKVTEIVQQKPGERGVGTGDRGLGHQQVVPFDTVRLNAGNAFDPTTHIFICPVDGVYVFQSALMAEQRDMIQV